MNTWSSITKTKFQHSFVFSFFFLITFLSLLLIFFNDIELNPSPMNDSPNYKFSISDCNLNSIAAQKIVKIVSQKLTLQGMAMILFVYMGHCQTRRLLQTSMICLRRITTYIALTIFKVLKKEEFVFIVKKPWPFLFYKQNESSVFSVKLRLKIKRKVM